MVFYSIYPSPPDDERRTEVSALVHGLNRSLADGCWEFDVTTGDAMFRTTHRGDVFDDAAWTDLVLSNLSLMDQVGSAFEAVIEGATADSELQRLGTGTPLLDAVALMNEFKGLPDWADGSDT